MTSAPGGHQLFELGSSARVRVSTPAEQSRSELHCRAASVRAGGCLSIIGDPDYVIREVQAQTRELGVGVLIALLHFGSMSHELASKNIRLFADKVLPELKRA